ncbi:transposase [Ruminococcus sp.]
MQNYCNIVKNKLNMLIRNMEKNNSDFVVDLKRDFVRKSELSFSKTMKFILGMGSRSLGSELMEFYGLDQKSVSVSAVVQRRTKILPAAFLHLFHKFNEAFSQTNFFHGYRLYAVDGSDIHIPTIPDDHSTHYNANVNSKGYNLMHLNAMYDLLNRRYTDAVLQDSRCENEHTALISMAKNVKCESIIVADRGYESYNTIAHLENYGLKYVIRIKTTAGIAQKFNIPVNKEIDFKHNDYRYKINYAFAIHACIRFFRSDHADHSLLEDLIARNKCPVRPNRIAVRKTRCHSAIGFNYRLS